MRRPDAPMMGTIERVAAEYAAKAAFGRCCVEVCEVLAGMFPGLEIRNGVFCPEDAKGEPFEQAPHWWLVDGDTIIDPSAAQFGLPMVYLTTVDDPRYIEMPEAQAQAYWWGEDYYAEDNDNG